MGVDVERAGSSFLSLPLSLGVFQIFAAETRLSLDVISSLARTHQDLRGPVRVRYCGTRLLFIRV